MVHLRIADALLGKFTGLDETAFVMGNIAPDSGVPNEDWSVFSPPKSVTHYKKKMEDGTTVIDIDAFCEEYFTSELIRSYSDREYSFFLGYYIHLLTDVEWGERVYRPAMRRYTETVTEDKNTYIEKMKEDWYDLDFRFLSEHPDFRAFRIYQQAAGFINEYMKQFSEDAFDNRREYICGFYRGEHGELYREYPYLSPEQADLFVRETVEKINSLLQ